MLDESNLCLLNQKFNYSYKLKKNRTSTTPLSRVYTNRYIMSFYIFFYPEIPYRNWTYIGSLEDRYSTFELRGLKEIRIGNSEGS